MGRGAATNNSNADDDFFGAEESKEGGVGGWDQQYLEDIFGAVDEIEDDDEVALEHLGEMEYRRQISEQEEIKRRSNSFHQSDSFKLEEQKQ